MIKATIDALKASHSPRFIAAKRSKKISDITTRRDKEVKEDDGNGAE